jgi:threonine synthase
MRQDGMAQPFTSGQRSRLAEPSSAAGFAALLALLYSPAIARLTPLTMVATGLPSLRSRRE